MVVDVSAKIQMLINLLPQLNDSKTYGEVTHLTSKGIV